MHTDLKSLSFFNRIDIHKHLHWMLMVLVLMIFLAILYPSLGTKKYIYQVGDVAKRDIKAHEDFFVEDITATENKRLDAIENVLTVYDYQPKLSPQITQKVKKAFESLRNVYIYTIPKPLEPLSSIENSKNTASDGLNKKAIISPDLNTFIWNKKNLFENHLGITISNGAYEILMEMKFSEELSSLLAKVINDIMEKGVVVNKEILLNEVDKGITLRDVDTQTEKTVQNLKQFYGPDQAKTVVRAIAQPLFKDLDYTVINLVVDLVQRLVQPNISLNRNETEARKKRTIAQIEPVMYRIKAGEMLVREGERVTDVQLMKLIAMEDQVRRGADFTTVSGATILLLFFILMAYHLAITNQRKFRTNLTQYLLFLTCILVSLFIVVRFGAVLSENWSSNTSFSIPASSLLYGIPVAYATMTICLFAGFELALYFALVAAFSSAILIQSRFELLTFFLLNCILGAYWVQNCRERKTIIFAGAKLGLINMLCATAIEFYLWDFSVINLIWNLTFAFVGGIGAAIITVGIAPLIEVSFHFTTDITLLELANLDRPLLRRLMLEAPGTYHHSVIVGSLVEAAAAEIGANPLLAKVCGYYHDIGKINKPLYFIENQRGGKNKHDKLAPSMSGLILIAHVKDGVEIARKNKLGQTLIDTIRQHHGTSLISYFYEKAKQLKGENQVKIDDFRYPGPQPQTKEAGLVMLADVVEAASRTLENPTPSRIQGLVQNLINKVFSDGQLDACELTLKDLHKIAKSFNKILNGIHHHRIEYSESATAKDGKSKDGNIDRQSTSQSRHNVRKGQSESKSHLKRLGMS
jgi:putative nucleotidyltransferase with HDIG domain